MIVYIAVDKKFRKNVLDAKVVYVREAKGECLEK